MGFKSKLREKLADLRTYYRWVDRPATGSCGLMRLIFEDLRRHELGWTRPGFRAVAVYRFGVWASTVRLTPLRILWLTVYAVLARHVRNHYGIELYHTARIGRRLVIGHQHGIVIHRFATIGNDCLIRQGVTFGEAGIGKDNFASGEGPVVGDFVDVGAGAIIIGNVRIGDGVNIGPNAVVVTDVPSHTTVFAPPSRMIARAAPVAAVASLLLCAVALPTRSAGGAAMLLGGGI